MSKFQTRMSEHEAGVYRGPKSAKNPTFSSGEAREVEHPIASALTPLDQRCLAIAHKFLNLAQTLLRQLHILQSLS